MPGSTSVGTAASIDMVQADVGRAPVRVARPVVFSRSARQALRSGAAWGSVFGIYTALQAMAYTSTYRTLAERRALAKSLSLSSGLNALAGTARDLQTVGGYTAWKSLGFLSVLGAIWALLIATKLLRGEEESGRAELLLSGPVTRRAETVQTILGLAVGLAGFFGCTALFVVLTGHAQSVHWGLGASLFFALEATCGAALFLAVGALTSQFANSRRRAAALAGGVLGLAFALRMLSDASSGATWIHWLTPLGWVEELGAFTSPSALPLLPLVVATGAALAGAIWLAGARDLGTGLLGERGTTRSSTRLLQGPLGLTVRQIGPITSVWIAGICTYALLLGAVANTAARSLEASPGVRTALGRLGGHGGLVKAYLGVAFLILTLMVMLVAATQLGAARKEEAIGRVESLLASPLSRVRWMCTRAVVAVGAIVVTGLLAGLFAWLGATSQHAHVSLVSMLAAGLNSVPAACCLLGIGVLAWAFVPRHAVGCTYAVLVWSFLVEILAGAGRLNRVVLDSSILHHVTLAPAVSPDWASGLALVGVGALTAILGVRRFAHRDLAGS